MAPPGGNKIFKRIFSTTDFQFPTKIFFANKNKINNNSVHV